MKNFDLRDLDAFVAVARTRNFRRAAIESRVSVSSLSQRLRDMEERLGVRPNPYGYTVNPPIDKATLPPLG